MRIAVIGAGALGSTFACLLAAQGHDLVVTMRGAALPTVLADGIRLTGGYGDRFARPLAVERLIEPCDLALICTKAQDAAAAIAENAAVLDGTPVIVVQNGLDGVTTAQRLLPQSECFGLITIIAAHYEGPGRVRVTTTAPSYLGRGIGPVDAGTLRWQAVLGAAAPTLALENFVGAQWTKLVVNMLNALPAITGRSVQEVIGQAGLRLLMTRSMRETVRVGLGRGVLFGSLQGLSHRRLRVFALAPIWAGQVLPLSMRSRMGTVLNQGSTLQSLHRGQRTEIDFLNGAVVRAAAAAGVVAPVNALLTELVHEVERSGAFLAPAEVCARFR
ncbi:MAG: 2-dehydropantoate 2-reductase [Cryobacterium sp.]|uniref:ketopantoate reductase family protein n=1 Tax=unclassified Cryobacterium TaxID=2649013 RepID=UPI0018C8FFD9|nr:MULTISPECIES: 2-dehydropantoate 2-reductase [unclassified Cryobacterium]MCY7405673.1 2-dehydropantoate 2-reductase [Cryobacterium sp.]MEC5155101.1 2-dehydropantoate 2-reductase [Cryobacterium sp. CAN_C3]